MRLWGAPGRRLVSATPLLLLLLLLSTRSVRADEVVLQSGRTERAYVTTQDGEIRLNVYGCSVPDMTLGVKRVRASDVREIRPHPLEDHLQRRLEELDAGDVARRLELMRLAQTARLKPWTQRLAQEVLRLRPTEASALKATGGETRWLSARTGDAYLDRPLGLEVRSLLRLESGRDRRREAERLELRYGYRGGGDQIERMVRSLRQERGLRADVPLRLEATAFPGARYTLYVPENYDPLQPRPLLVALHGGGIMKEVGASVRGSARDALAHYLEGVRERGWFLLCPNAVEAPWTTPRNRAYLETALDEVLHLWNIDTERVHLAGQGGGADGVWAWASRAADRFASVGVAAGGKPISAGPIARKTGLWMYHGAADDIVPVEPVRKAAAQLLRQKVEFVYCELPREGHGLAPAARRDYFRYVSPKRRLRAASAWPTSSFATPSSKAAIAAFGDPRAGWGLGLKAGSDPSVLMEILRQGRNESEHAARHLLEAFAETPPEIGARVRRVLSNPKSPTEARIWAAWLCGRWKDSAAVDALGDALRASDNERLLRYAAVAVGRIGSPDSAQDLRWALSSLAKRYRSVKGKTIPFQAFERACRLGAVIADSIGLCVVEGDDVLALLEEDLVRSVLMDRRLISFEASIGENPVKERSALAGALALSYRRLKAEPTLFEMLKMAVRKDPAALAAVKRGMRGSAR